MLKILHENKEYRLRFQHLHRNIVKNLDFMEEVEQELGSSNGRTTAVLEVMRIGDDPPKERVEEVLLGVARCHPQDNYDKETGRQFAIKHLLENQENGISRELAGKILYAYFTRKKH